MTTTMIAPPSVPQGSLAESETELDREATWDDPPANPPRLSVDAADIERELRALNLNLAREAEIPDDLRPYLEQLADTVDSLAAGGDIDPYLLVSAQSALNHAMRLFFSSDLAGARREMRTRLEQMRQVFRDIAEGGPLYEDTSAKEIARWLVDALDTSQASLAELLGVSARTLQRWISESASVGPDGEDARRVRVVARIANHLRHALTGPGVVRWFQLPHPQLGRRRPLDVLDDPQAAELLTTLAASTRSHTAA
jgi:uncharacterized protein (DUF2384 family)